MKDTNKDSAVTFEGDISTTLRLKKLAEERGVTVDQIIANIIAERC